MHSSHAAFICREFHREELLSFAEQQQLVKLACTGTTCMKPHEATAMAILAFVHHVTAFMSTVLRDRPSAGPASTATESPQPFNAPTGSSG